jgi:hypothetical protein
MITRPKLEDYAFPKSENDYEQLGFYTDYLEDYCDALEKALDNACKYIHNDGIDGCPFNYDLSAIESEKMNECNICDYQCSSERSCEEYLKKSVKCWKEYFLKGDQQNESK